MKVAIRGMGRMGREVAEVIGTAEGIDLLTGIDPRGGGGLPCVAKLAELTEIKEKPDCIVDISLHSEIEELLTYAKAHQIPLVIGTTGFTELEQAHIHAASKHIPIFQSSNFSSGLSLLTSFARQVAKLLPDGDIEIVECHHREKRDAPSGTALALFSAIQSARAGAEAKIGRNGDTPCKAGEVGIHSLRLGEAIGEHTLYITTPTQQLVLRHTATSRRLFAEGALRAIQFITRQRAALYGMEDLWERN